MEDVASILFMVGGALTYPLFFHLSLKKSLSIASKAKIPNVKVLFSLIVIYFESVALPCLIAYFAPFGLPSYFPSILAITAVVFSASYTLKVSFDLTFRRGVLAFALWQLLSLGVGGLFVITVLAAMLKTILAFLLVIALMLLSLWMWDGKPSVVAGGEETGVAKGRNTGLGDSEKKAITVAMVALLCSSLVVPSAVQFVSCEPQPDTTEQDVDVEFEWMDKLVRANIVWNQTEANAAGGGDAAGSSDQPNPTLEGVVGIGQGAIDIVWGIVNVPGALYSLHDFKAATTYLSLVNDVTQLQRIMEPQPPLLPQNCQFGPKDVDLGSVSPFAKDEALAERLSDMSRKEFKVEVAQNPDYIDKAVDIEKYVDGVAWDSAFTNYFTLNFPMACETYQKVKAETKDEGEALWQAARIFGLTSPYLEFKEAWDSGDPRKIGNSGVKALFTFVTTYLLLKSAYNVARGEGLLAGVSKAAYDLVMPAQTLYSILKSGVLKARGAIAAIRDIGLKEALTVALDNLASRFRSTEYIEYPLWDEDAPVVGTYDRTVFDGGGLEESPLVSIPKETHVWPGILDDASVAKKITSESWVRSFINEIKDYQKLDEIGIGEAEIQGLKIKIEKGTLQAGYGNPFDKSYFNLEFVDTGTIIRVYEENTISVWHGKRFLGLKIEQLEADGAGIESLETETRTDLTTILMGDYLKKIRFFDKFVTGQEVEIFGVKGTVKDKGEYDNPYVIIKFKVDTGRGSGVKEVRISPSGASVNKRTIVDVEAGEDGAVYLLYEHGDKVLGTPIKLPITDVNLGKLVEADDLASELDYNDILGRSEAGLFGELGIKNSKDFTDRVAYAVFGRNKKAFDAKYGEGKCEALMKAADVFAKSATDKAFEELGLDIETVVKAGVRAGKPGEDIAGKTKDGTVLKVDIEFAGSGYDRYSSQVYNIILKFAERKDDLGMIFWEGEYHVFINPATKYEPLANIAKDLACAGSRSIKDFAGVSAIASLGLLSSYLTGANGEAVSVTDDTGRWIGEFQDSYLDHTAVDGSTVFNCSLTLTSVDGSYLQKVRSTGSSITGSTLTNSNVSARLIYDSFVQNTLAVCSTIVNSVINLCRILNSTLVSVVDMVGSYIEDTSIAYSANISNCTVMGSNLMSVLNVSNTSITGSNLTLVANVNNTRVDHSDISYSANISRSEILNTKLVGCTVQGSRLMSCTAVDSILRNVNATNSNLSGTSAELSNLVNVNATNSKLTKANVEYSNLQNVELKKAEVIGTDLTNRKVVDQTIVYGRVIDSNDNIIDPWRRVGTPNYSGQSNSSASKTKGDASGGKAGSTTSTTTTSSSSGQTQTSSTQTQATTSQGKTSNSQVSTMRQKLGQQAAAGSNAQQTPNTQTQAPNTKASDNQATTSQQRTSATDQQVPPMMRQKLGGQVKADTGSSAQTSSSTQTETPQQTTTTTSPQTSTTTTTQQTVEKPIKRGANIWIS